MKGRKRFRKRRANRGTQKKRLLYVKSVDYVNGILVVGSIQESYMKRLKPVNWADWVAFA